MVACSLFRPEMRLVDGDRMRFLYKSAENARRFSIPSYD